ncbi:uncharacterized protein LOC134209941 [Armigeres subalbatus]|uniref:uncharacterized protein LOC134209941 n=1 Tax=Armigeres subalbatus TaxID=124917 RepID=UPI002ED241C5
MESSSTLDDDNGAVIHVVRESKKVVKKRLKAALEENDALRARLAQLEQASVCNKPENDEDNHQQDIQNSPVALRDDSNLLATMNNWTLSTINIPECTPSDGETDIDKSAFEYWKDTFISSIKLVNSTDEDTLFGLLKSRLDPNCGKSTKRQ